MTYKLKSSAYAVLYTSRFNPTMNTVDAQIAFPSNPSPFIKKESPIRTTMYTELTASTYLLIDHDNPIFPLRYGVYRTEISAHGIITLDTHNRHKVHVEFLIYPSGLDRHDFTPSGLGFIGEVMFLPARQLTGIAADAVI